MSARRLPIWIPILATLLPSLSPGCATAPQRGGAPAESGLRPLTVPVTLVAGEGDARGPAGQAFAPLGKDAPTVGVAEVRAESGAAVVLGSLDGPRAKLWLHGGSSVKLGEDERGGLVVEVT